MSSETSTKTAPGPADAGLQARHLFILLSMVGATVAVMLVGHGQPLGLIVLSLTVVAVGLVGVAIHSALAGFLGVGKAAPEPRSARQTEGLEREKALVLRSIKELEFDRAMGKVSDADFAELSGRLRTRALALMQELELAKPAERSARRAERRGPEAAPARPASPAVERAQPAAAPADADAFCSQCGAAVSSEARFCKRCGARVNV